MSYRNCIFEEDALDLGSDDGGGDIEATLMRHLAKRGVAVSRAELRRVFADLRAAFVEDLAAGRTADLLGVLKMQQVGGELQTWRSGDCRKPVDWNGE